MRLLGGTRRGNISFGTVGRGIRIGSSKDYALAMRVRGFVRRRGKGGSSMGIRLSSGSSTGATARGITRGMTSDTTDGIIGSDNLANRTTGVTGSVTRRTLGGNLKDAKDAPKADSSDDDDTTPTCSPTRSSNASRRFS